MGAKILTYEDAQALRAEIEAKYGSVHMFAKATGISSPDIYSLLNCNKPMYPKWEDTINRALDVNGDDIGIALFNLCKRVEQISVELNALWCQYKQTYDFGKEREVINE